MPKHLGFALLEYIDSRYFITYLNFIFKNSENNSSKYGETEAKTLEEKIHQAVRRAAERN